MNVPPITKEGTYAEVSVLPYPWPPANEMVLRRRTASDGEFRLIATTDGRLWVAIVKTGADAPTLQAKSCPISGPHGAPFIILIAWSEKTGEVDIRVNGTTVGSRLSPDAVPVSYSHPGAFPSSANMDDFSTPSRGALIDRKNRWDNFKPKEDRFDGGKEYVLAEFKDSIAILSDHLESVREGKKPFIK
jgi:hypothetical protein